jgi:hypothetical protein
MGDAINDLIDKIATLENDLGRALSERAEDIKHDLQNRRIEFEAEILRRHKELRQGLLIYLSRARLLSYLTAPVIYSLIIPLVIFDVFLFVYQSICFPAYGIAKVHRGDYLIFDRAYLDYLNPIEKLNCAFCSYANGLIAYAREIAGRTEAYWCPIKHARNYLGAHRYYHEFHNYGDAEAYRGGVQVPNKRTEDGDTTT